MDPITKAAKAAYESVEGGQTSKRVQWEHLSGFWQDYWKAIAAAALATLSA